MDRGHGIVGDCHILLYFSMHNSRVSFPVAQLIGCCKGMGYMIECYEHMDVLEETSSFVKPR
jgi:hypothetical protein